MTKKELLIWLDSFAVGVDDETEIVGTISDKIRDDLDPITPITPEDLHAENRAEYSYLNDITQKVVEAVDDYKNTSKNEETDHKDTK